eukprot:768767-Hanusia_phi.AAC.3
MPRELRELAAVSGAPCLLLDSELTCRASCWGCHVLCGRDQVSSLRAVKEGERACGCNLSPLIVLLKKYRKASKQGGEELKEYTHRWDGDREGARAR